MYENIKLQIIYAYLKTDLKLAKQKGKRFYSKLSNVYFKPEKDQISFQNLAFLV